MLCDSEPDFSDSFPLSPASGLTTQIDRRLGERQSTSRRHRYWLIATPLNPAAPTAGEMAARVRSP